MQQLRINGGNRLVGEVRASGAKNAALSHPCGGAAHGG